MGGEASKMRQLEDTIFEMRLSSKQLAKESQRCQNPCRKRNTKEKRVFKLFETVIQNGRCGFKNTIGK